MSLDRRRGYIRVEEDDEDVLERWDLPSYGKGQALPRDTALNYDPGWQPEEISEDQEELPPEPLTADALESIRQSGYDEGFEEGKSAGLQEGLEAGLEEGKAKGFEEGKEQGYQAGLKEAQALIEQRCQHLDSVLGKLSTPVSRIDQEVEAQVVDLVQHLTRELIRIEVETNSQVILSTLREAVDALPMSGRTIQISLHPEDHQVVSDAYDEQQQKDRKWTLMAEPALQRGDVLVKADDSVVDYRMEDRVKALMHQFLGQYQQRRQIDDRQQAQAETVEQPSDISAEAELSDPQASLQTDETQS